MTNNNNKSAWNEYGLNRLHHAINATPAPRGERPTLVEGWAGETDLGVEVTAMVRYENFDEGWHVDEVSIIDAVSPGKDNILPMLQQIGAVENLCNWVEAQITDNLW